jgi:preprotein translocase subunit SecD
VSVLITLAVCFGVFAAVLSVGWRPLLGLDLRGGFSVVYCPAARGSNTKCAPTNQVKTATLDQVVSILQNRANGLGVAQPNIGVQGGDVVAQLPGVKNPAKAEAILGETAQLYFRPVLCYAPPYQKPASTSHPKKNGKVTTKKSSSSTSTTSTSSPSSSSSSSSTSSPSSSSSTSSTVASKSSTTTTSPSTSTSTSTTTTTVPTSSTKLPVCPTTYQPTSTNNPTPYPILASFPTTPPQDDLPTSTVLLKQQGFADRLELGPAIANGSIIKSAVALDESSGWQINFTLTGPGTTTFNQKIAVPYFHKLVADDLGGVVETAPVIDATNFPGSGQITGTFTSSQANTIALVLNYGALPVRLVQQDTQRVSPTLGSQSLRAGMLAGLLGLLLVMAYTIFYYRALGIVVVIGLVSTAALLYGIIAWLSHSSANLTLDLSGITGLIVSVGITVDSYVVYFERLKDEVRAGRSVRASVDRGFKSAYRTILSADAVSFIGALVLWLLSVGAVRGFAFMLGLSTLIDVATAYFFTRPLVILLGRNRIFTEARGLGIARGLALPRPTEGPA